MTLFISWFALVGGVWTLFERAEAVVTNDVKKAVARWLRVVGDSSRATDWTRTFTNVFDAVFGRRHLSVACFVKSSAASVAAVLILISLWAAIHPDQAIAAAGAGHDNIYRLHPVLYTSLNVLVALLLNTIPDYVSLLETRLVLGAMNRTRSTAKWTGWLLLDIVLTGAISYGFIRGLEELTLVTGSDRSKTLIAIPNDMSSWIDNWFLLSTHKQGLWPEAIWFYSSFVTSMWLWLYVSGGLVYRATATARRAWAVSSQVLDIDASPLRAIGFVAILLVSALYWLCIGIGYLLLW